MNYASPLRAALPASKLYYSYGLYPITSLLLCLALKAAVQVSVKPLALDGYDHQTECFQDAGRITEMGPVFKTYTPGVIHQ